MKSWLYIVVGIMFSLSAFAEECGPQADKFAFESLIEFSKKSCEDIKASNECQNLYSEIKKNGDNPEDKALQCSDSNIVWRGLKADFDFRIGCAMGGWNYAVDTISTWGHLIGESAAKIKLTIEEAKAENEACNKDFEKKKSVYAEYNQSVPKMLQIEVPDDATLKRVDCAQLKAGARMMQTRQGMFAMGKVRQRLSDPNAKYNPEEQEYVNWINSLKGKGGNFPDLIGLAEKKLNELGIKLECYNTRETAALVCEGMAMVATNIGGGPAAFAATSARIARISKLAGVSLKEAKAVAAKKALGRELTEAQKDAVFDAHNVGLAERRGYRTQGGIKGEYTWGDLKKKSQKMKAADFDKAERRVLMETGIAGNPVSPATTLGRADQKFIPNINEAMARRNTEAVTQAASEGNKHYKSLLNSSPEEIKKALPENNLQAIVEANYFGLGTDDTAKLASKYFEAHGYDEVSGKLAVISRLRQDSRYYLNNPKVDTNISGYRVYRSKELEYKMWKDYYETRYPDKYNELDYDKLSEGQRKNLETLAEDVKKLREQAQKYKWPGYQQNGSAY